MLLLDVARELDRSGVRYAVAGGYAVALHGAVRGTVDLDLVLAHSRKNYVATEAALMRLGFQPRLPVDGGQVFDFRQEYIDMRNLVAWSFYDPRDASRLVDVIITFARKRLPTVAVDVEGQTVQLLAKSALLEMKRQSGRPQDLEDIRALESLP